MSCCCAGTGSGCCCPNPASNYVVSFSGIYDVSGTGTGTAPTDGVQGCFLMNRSFCLCYRACDYYVGGSDLLEGEVDEACLRSYNSFRVTLQFDCTGNTAGTGSGTGTYAETGVARLTVKGVCLYTGVEVTLAIYERALDSWHCEATSHTMARSWTHTDCLGWPTTVTVTQDSTGLVCRCTCGPGVAEIGQAHVYEVIMGAITDNGCPAGDCGCEVVTTRICMRDLGHCAWSGRLNTTVPGDIAYFDPLLIDSGITYYPESCAPAYPDTVFYPTGKYKYVAYLYYYPATNKVYFGWKDVPEIGLSSAIVTSPTDDWLARYSIDADSFLVEGDNTFTYEGGSYSTCNLPTTIQVNYYSTSNNDCDQPEFDCDICEPGKVFPGGWTFTLAGVTGPTETFGPFFTSNPYLGGCLSGVGCVCQVVPCSALNGDYCLGLNGDYFGNCAWRTYADGSSPDPVYYTATDSGSRCRYYRNGSTSGDEIYAYATAAMAIYGGIVVVQIMLIARYAGALGYTCKKTWNYVCSVEGFDCNGDNVLTLQCNEPLDSRVASGNDTVACACTSMPTTITISPTTECGPTPPSGCQCLTGYAKTYYSPRITITGIDEGSCSRCSCLNKMELCFTGTGVVDECTWRADFTLPSTDPYTCSIAATYALLSIGITPNDTEVVFGIYDATNTLLVEFRGDIFGSGFSCETTDFALTYSSASATCDWSGASVSLDMHGATCPTTCAPCESEFSQYTIRVTYNAIEYTLCATQTSSCTYRTESMNASGEIFYAVLEFGPVPLNSVKVLIYLDSGLLSGTGSGTSPTDILIGVYNWIYPGISYVCADGNTLYLGTGNSGYCGSDVDVSGFTSYLGADVTVTGDCGTMPFCDGVEMPTTVTLSNPVDWDRGCECAIGTPVTLTYVGSNQWTGTFSCFEIGAAVFTNITVTFEQTGTAFADLRLTWSPADSCDSFANEAPMSGSCGAALFGNGSDISPRYRFLVSW